MKNKERKLKELSVIMNNNSFVLENELFTPAIKELVDFGFAELPHKRGSVLHSLQGKGLTNKIKVDLYIIPDSYRDY